MDTRAEKGTGFEGQQHVMLPARVIETALREQPLLRSLLVAGAGYFPKAGGHLRRRPHGTDQAILVYCVKGRGWGELNGQRLPVRAGELLVVPPHVPHAYGASADQPWTIHWVHAVGANLRAYLHALKVTAHDPVVWLGEDLQLTLLFNELVTSLARDYSFRSLLHASQALAHLLALLIRHRHERLRSNADVAQRVAQSIVYMSERLQQPLRIPELAALANLSPAHFTVRFKQQTGSAPRDYLHLLRIHRACQLLHGTGLTVKEIAAQVGYQDPFHFSRQFKAAQGVSPTEYRAYKSG